MARKRYGFDEAKIARFQKEGRGQGRGADYKPWLKISDVPSHGRSSRPKGLKTGRVHHFLSDIERHVFHLFDWDDAVEDIREQFPLDRDGTQRIAENLGFDHPRDISSRVPLVMTTDFLIDIVRDGKVVLLARAVKRAQDLDDKRVLEKLEIERRYWAEQGVDWGIVTELDIPMVRARNIDWIRHHATVSELTQPYGGYFEEKAAILLRELPYSPKMSLGQFCREMDARLSMEEGTALMLVRHLLGSKALTAPMDEEPLDHTIPVDWLQPSEAGNRAAGAC